MNINADYLIMLKTLGLLETRYFQTATFHFNQNFETFYIYVKFYRRQEKLI